MGRKEKSHLLVSLSVSDALLAELRAHRKVEGHKQLLVDLRSVAACQFQSPEGVELVLSDLDKQPEVLVLAWLVPNH